MHAVLGLLLAFAPIPKETDADLRAAVVKTYGLEADAKDTPVRKLQKERCIERGVAILRMKSVMEFGNWDARFLGEYTRLQITFAENLAELTDKPAEKLKWFEMRAEKLKDLEKFMAARVEAGAEPPQSLNIARANRIDADLEVLKLKESIGSTDPEALIKSAIADMRTLADLLEKKEDQEKLKAAASKLKGTMGRLESIKLPKEKDDELKKKYEKELTEAAMKMMGAALSNPEGAKALEVLKPLVKK